MPQLRALQPDILAIAVAGRYQKKGVLVVGDKGDYSSYNVDFLMEKKVGDGGAFSVEGEYIVYDQLGGYDAGFSEGDKSYADYQKRYKAAQENNKFLGIKNSTWEHNLNPLNWPSMAVGAAKTGMNKLGSLRKKADEQGFAGNTGSAQASMSSGQRDAGVKAWNGIKGAFSEAGQAQADNTAAQVKAQQDTLAGIKKAWGDAGDWINTNWCDLMVKIQSKFDGAAQWVEDRWNGVKDWFGTTGQKIGDFFSGIPSEKTPWPPGRPGQNSSNAKNRSSKRFPQSDPSCSTEERAHGEDGFSTDSGSAEFRFRAGKGGRASCDGPSAPPQEYSH